MKYLTEKQVLKIHKGLVDETSGSHGVRDLNLLRSAIERPKHNKYKSVFEKAACYFESLAKNHAFIDGNKRVSIAATTYFLFLQGYKLKVSNKTLFNFTLAVVNKDKKIEEIAYWLKQNCEKRNKI